MIKIEEVINRVQSLYSKGVKSDDSRLSSRQIYSVAKGVRNTLLSNQIKKRQFISDWSYVIIKPLKMKKVSSLECTQFSHLGCDIYRTENKIPGILTHLNSYIIDWVMQLDSNYIIEPTTKQESLYNSGNKYTKNKYKYIIENGYIYINSSVSPKAVQIKFIPTDPIEAFDFGLKCVNHNTCLSNYEKEFYIEEDLLTPLIQMTFQECIEIFSQMKEDKTNNSSDSLKQESK